MGPDDTAQVATERVSEEKSDNRGCDLLLLGGV